jgi:ABC-type branched-subunit amino acid transport system substrate-binding protein
MKQMSLRRFAIASSAFACASLLSFGWSDQRGAALLSLSLSAPAAAQQPGITETEIKFGNIMPYSGPASALSITGKAFAAYFDSVNEKGGVNGRKLNMNLARRRLLAAKDGRGDTPAG